jgi:hypothetical protein
VWGLWLHFWNHQSWLLRVVPPRQSDEHDSDNDVAMDARLVPWSPSMLLAGRQHHHDKRKSLVFKRIVKRGSVSAAWRL